MQNDSKLLPELNLKVIVLGLLLSVIMGSANVYLGLKAGMTVSASIPAAVKALNNVDLPTFGSPTIPHLRLIIFFLSSMVIHYSLLPAILDYFFSQI